MELLNINLPSILRIQYPNNELRDIWEPKIESAKKLSELQLLTMIHDVRKVALIAFPKDQMVEKIAELSRQGIFILPASKVGTGKGYSHQFNGAKEFNYHCYLTKDRSIMKQLAQAEKDKDNITIGELLGYPKCCTHHFDTYWSQGIIDPIWQQATNTDEKWRIPQEEPNRIRIHKDLFTETSSIFRYLGVRLCYHMPCSFCCIDSLHIAEQWIELADHLGLKQSVEDTFDIMNLAVEWDCTKGVAIISTPAFKFIVNSVPYKDRYVVQKEGIVPDNTPNAVKFPWRQKGGCA